VTGLAITSIPSANFTPRISFGNGFLPSRRCRRPFVVSGEAIPLPSARTNGKGMASEHLDFQHVAFLELID
jgi:hypothetical protein